MATPSNVHKICFIGDGQTGKTTSINVLVSKAKSAPDSSCICFELADELLGKLLEYCIGEKMSLNDR